MSKTITTRARRLTFGTRARDLTFAKLAERLGVDPAIISRWCAGEATTVTTEAIAAALSKESIVEMGRPVDVPAASLEGAGPTYPLTG